MVGEANAIVYPRAMVVHLENASSAHPTMVASVWLVLCTPLAMAPVSRSFGFLEVDDGLDTTTILQAVVLCHVLPVRMANFFLFWDRARMCKDTPEVADSQHYGRKIEDDELHQAMLPCGRVLNHGYAMETYVNEPQPSDLPGNERYRQPLRWLSEASFTCFLWHVVWWASRA